MSSHQIAEQIADNYMRSLSEGNLDGVMALYADDATVEDPVGSEPLKGKEAIRAFYQVTVDMKVKAERTGPVRYAAGELVFPFVVTSNAGEKPMHIEVIDHFVLNEDNLIVSMRAFWSEANMG